ncbi:HAUS augmin-like complex subunit 3 [Pristis pectinata]|uniref:HAUS augmin-like complex subunit 3 n=1 Tax=Pristis pectinata TaxID=685728 RepID=UPI00223D349E|nr:HAUS augmin-like complex subunit 3 [Pristis pectinata]XP_051876568.1 HAUS augmin-like complex subunit 3 [Pristis pectinata]XP_051876569.1 HAUS augmin-like complex subunit 3 [Pristis pectinata]
MNGRIFVETLKKIGYPNANQLNGEHFDWWFDIGDERMFVEWFCNTVNEQNVLTEEELSGLKRLEVEDRLLDQKDLDQVLETCPKDVKSKYGSLAEMTIEELEKEVEALQLTRSLKIQRRNKQQMMASRIHHMPMRLRDEEEECARLLRETHEQLTVENAELNSTLLKIQEVVQELSSTYSDTESGKIPEQEVVFLSQLVLDQYLLQEEQCTAALTEYTKKQLFKGIAELVESSDVEKFQLVDLTSQPIHGECDEVLEYKKQMARIQAAYSSSQHLLILAKAKEQSTEARLQYMEQIISSIQNRKLIDDANGAKAKKNSLSKELTAINIQIEQLINNELPDLIVENAQLLNMPVVKGNFDLQMSRQDYYTSKQDQVASQLIKQKARFELLQLAYEMELCKHRETHRHLENLTTELNQTRGEFVQRLDMLSDKSLLSSNKQRTIIDSSDTSTVRLSEMFVGDNKQQLFKTYSGLEEEAKNLQQELAYLKDQ